MNTLNQVIIDRIKNYYTCIGLEVLLITEMGSRAWGYATPNSDHDILVVYRAGAERLLFGFELSPPDLGSGITVQHFEFAKFIDLTLKFNINCYSYLQVSHYLTSQPIILLRRVLLGMIVNEDVKTKYLIQACSMVKSYAKKNKTIKDWIRLTYLACYTYQWYKTLGQKQVLELPNAQFTMPEIASGIAYNYQQVKSASELEVDTSLPMNEQQLTQFYKLLTLDYGEYSHKLELPKINNELKLRIYKEEL